MDVYCCFPYLSKGNQINFLFSRKNRLQTEKGCTKSPLQWLKAYSVSRKKIFNPGELNCWHFFMLGNESPFISMSKHVLVYSVWFLNGRQAIKYIFPHDVISGILRFFWMAVKCSPVFHHRLPLMQMHTTATDLIGLYDCKLLYFWINGFENKENSHVWFT